MPVYIKDNTKVLFIHIPKSAGSTISKLFIDNGFSQLLNNKDRLSWSPCCPQHYTESMIDDILPLEYDYSFTVVREPISRLHSEYMYRKAYKSISFDAFVISSLMLYKFNKFIYDNHITPQSEFIKSNNVKIFYFNNGVSVIRNELANLNIISKNTNIEHIYKSEIREIKISKLTLNLIKKFYSSDYNRFKFNKVDYKLKKLNYFKLMLDVSNNILLYLFESFKRKIKFHVRGRL